MSRWLRTLMYVLTLRCEEADRLRSCLPSGEVTRAQRIGERLHRLICSSCRHARRQLQSLDEALGTLAKHEADSGDAHIALSSGARRRLSRVLDETLDSDDSPARG